MSSIVYNISGVTNTQLTELDGRLNVDPGLAQTYTGYTYSDPTLTLNFNSTVTEPTQIISDNLVSTIIAGETAPVLDYKYWDTYGPRFIHSSTTDPISTNDNLDDFSQGSLWFNTTNSRVWVCLDASQGAAIWKQLHNPRPVINAAQTGIPTNSAANAPTSTALTGTYQTVAGNITYDSSTGDWALQAGHTGNFQWTGEFGATPSLYLLYNTAFQVNPIISATPMADGSGATPSTVGISIIPASTDNTQAYILLGANAVGIAFYITGLI